MVTQIQRLRTPNRKDQKAASLYNIVVKNVNYIEQRNNIESFKRKTV
jgi:hypothetical protein